MKIEVVEKPSQAMLIIVTEFHFHSSLNSLVQFLAQFICSNLLNSSNHYVKSLQMPAYQLILLDLKGLQSISIL